MKTLLIYAHPTPDKSFINAELKNDLLKKYSQLNQESSKQLNHNNFDLLDLKLAYPTDQFDVKREQKRLCEYDTIILQFPFYWYTMPYNLKKYLDEVIVDGYGFGTNYYLANKSLQVITTVGSAKSTYTSTSYNNYPIEAFLIQFEQIASLCQMNYLSPLAIYEANRLQREDYRPQLQAVRDNYLQKIAEILVTSFNN